MQLLIFPYYLLAKPCYISLPQMVGHPLDDIKDVLTLKLCVFFFFAIDPYVVHVAFVGLHVTYAKNSIIVLIKVDRS